MRRGVMAMIVLTRLAAAPLAGAQDETGPAGPIAASAAREAARAAATTRGAMPAGLKWTGVGLLAGSGLPVLVARFGDCIPDDFSCRDQRTAAYVVGGAMAGTGLLLLLIADAKRPSAVPLPSIAMRDGRAFVQQRITF